MGFEEEGPKGLKKASHAGIIRIGFEAVSYTHLDVYKRQAFNTRNSFEDLDALLVFEGNILLAGNGHSIDFKTSSQIEWEPADLVVAVVAHGNVIVGDRGVVFDHIGDETRDLVVEQIARDDGGREWGVKKRSAVESAHGDGVGQVIVIGLAVHDDGGGDWRERRRRGFLLGRWSGGLRGGYCRLSLGEDACRNGKAEKNQAADTRVAAGSEHGYPLLRTALKKLR